QHVFSKKVSTISLYPLSLNIIIYCLILFAVIWLVAAFWTKRSVYRESRWRRLGYGIPILVGGYLVFKCDRLSDLLDLRVIMHVHAFAWTGVFLFIAVFRFFILASVSPV